MKKLAIIVISLFFTNMGFSQNCTCSLTGSQFPSSTLTPTTSWQTQTILSVGSYYQVFNVVAGNEYTWSICAVDGGSCAIDTRMNLYNGTSSIAYSCDVCGQDPKIIWTSTVTGTVKIMVHWWNGSSNPCSSNASNSTTLAYKISNSACINASFTSQPQNQTVTAGNTATFATNSNSNATLPVTYEWYKNGNLLPCCYTSQYTTSATQLADNGSSFYCKMINCSGSSTQSNTAYLYVNQAPTGSVNVTLTPSGAISNGAQWNIDGGASQSSGTTLSNISTGTHTINFLSASGYSSPSSQTITVASNQTTNVTGTYTLAAQYGSVNVTILPSGAISNGAQWNIDGGASQSSGATLSNISTGSHIVNFLSATGYSSPSSQTITVTANQTNNVTGTYTVATQFGSVNVTLLPIGAVSNGAQWNLDGGSSQSSGATLTNVPTGSHTINYLSATGYSSPASRSITVINNQTNSVTGTYTQTGSTPTIQVIYPNGNETWVIGSPYNITANVSNSFTGAKNIYVSYDGGTTWNLIGATNANSISYSWTPSYIPSISCKIKVTSNYQGQTISDASDANFTIQSSSNGQGFGLSSSTTSHLYWPFSGSNWDNSPTAGVRDGWKSGDEGGPGSAQGQGGHNGGEYHAQDWNRVIADLDCQKDYLAPLSGTVIYAHATCTPYCVQNCTLTNGQCCGNGFGNTVIIRSDLDNQFAFRVSHLYSTNVTQGQHVNAGDLLGSVGMTGNGTGSHAHCTLYKNITSVYTPGITALQRLSAGASLGFTGSNSNFSANYLFDAVLNGAGGGMPENPIISATQTTLCTGDSAVLTASQGTQYFWSTGDTSQTIIVHVPGNYSVLVNDLNGNLISSQTISVTQRSSALVHIISATNLLCQGTSLELNASTNLPDTVGDSFDDDANTYLWSTGSTYSGITITQPGTYTLNFRDGFNCASSSDSISISMISTPAKPNIIANGTQLASNTIAGCTYQWYLNGRPIDNAQSQFLTADSTGYYTVAATNSNGCSTLSDPAYMTILAIEEADAFSTLNIYPNPNNGKFTISLKSQTEKMFEVSCFNIIGDNIYTKDFVLNNGEMRTELDFTSFGKGVYFLKISAKGKSIFKKITIAE